MPQVLFCPMFYRQTCLPQINSFIKVEIIQILLTYQVKYDRIIYHRYCIISSLGVKYGSYCHCR